MVVTNVDSIEYLELIQEIFAGLHYRFLIVAVGREAENRKFYDDLETEWASIEDLTEKKIVFLHFKLLNRNEVADEQGFIDTGYGERVYANGIKLNRNIDLHEISKYSRNEKIRILLEKIKNEKGYRSFPLDHKPKLNKGDWNELYNPASMLLKQFGKEESDLPFLYVHDLGLEKSYYLNIDEMYQSYGSVYFFLKVLKQTINVEGRLRADLERTHNTYQKIRNRLQHRNTVLDYGRYLENKHKKSEVELHEIKNFCHLIGMNNELADEDISDRINYIKDDAKKYKVDSEAESKTNEAQVLYLEGKLGFLEQKLRMLYVNLFKRGMHTINENNSGDGIKGKVLGFLNDQRELGQNIYSKLEKITNATELDSLIAEYDGWDKINCEILEKAYVDTQLFRMYAGITYLGNIYIDPLSFQGKREKLTQCLPRKLEHLNLAINHTRDIRNIDMLPFDKNNNTPKGNSKTTLMKKLFISHASADVDKIKPLIDLVEGIGLPHTQLFYSSHPAYGVALGENIFDRLKKELSGDVFALFILSENFYKSAVCLCEMGAVWIKSNKQIPILIPPFDYGSMKGVFPDSLGFKIDDKSQLNSFKSELENYFGLTPIHNSRWDDKRDDYISKIAAALK